MKKLFNLLHDNTADGLILAQINGSILAIFIGLFSAYYMYLFSTLDSMQFQMFKETLKINSVRGFHAGDSEKEFLEVARWNYSEDKMNSILKELFFISSGSVSDKYTNNPIERGKIALFNISKISSHYPFPPMSGNGIIVSSGQPLIFKDLQEIEDHVHKIAMVAQTILPLYNDPSSKLKPNIKAYIKTTKNPELLNEVFQRFLSDLRLTSGVVESIKTQLLHYKLYRDRHLSKPIFIIYLLLAFITFFMSVILPMFKNTFSRFVIIGIPVFFYCLSFVLIIIEIAKL